MRKTLTILMAIIILMVGLVILTGCESKNGDNGNFNGENNKGSGIDLIFDFAIKETSYKAHINTNKGDELAEQEEDEPNFIIIDNKEKNYSIDLTLDEDAEDAYEQFKTSAKENDIFEEVKYGKYTGYYSNDGDDVLYGYILLDDSDPDAYIYLMFSLYLYDDEAENNDIREIYSSSNIQNILNNVEFKTSKLEVEE